MSPLPRTADEWAAYAAGVVHHFLQVEQAAVWPELEAHLTGSEWIRQHYDRDFPPQHGIDAHHLTGARTRLTQAGLIRELPAVLQKRRVSAWVDAAAHDARGTATAVDRRAATKRRTYRRFLTWAGRTNLCGAVAERRVHASLRELAGSYLWLPPSHRPGRVNEIHGRRVAVGGPLDGAGDWAVDPEDPSKGFVPFAIEAKNIRSVIYPWDNETWDLLAKVATFPEVVPILVARRLHYTTFRFFKDIGALGIEYHEQWFTQGHDLERAEFQDITKRLHFRDARLVDDPDTSSPVVVRFFKTVAHRHDLLRGQVDRWSETAPIAALFPQLRDADLPYLERRDLWRQYADDIRGAGFYELGGWAPQDV